MADQVDADNILHMFTGYQTTAIVRAGVELKVFEALADGATSPAAVAADIGAPQRTTGHLLEALSTLGLVKKVGEGYCLADGAAKHLLRTSPAYLGDLARVFVSDYFWEAYRRLPEAIRAGGTTLEDNAETPNHPLWEDFAAYSTAMAAPPSETVADMLAKWASERRPLNVLEVACGAGLFGLAMARRQPHARVTLLDWPAVLEHARRNVEEAGVLERVELLPGDMFQVGLGGPYDLVILSQVFHHFSQQRSAELIQRLRAAMVAGGRIVIHEFALSDQSDKDDPFLRLFSLWMVAWTREGETYSTSQFQTLLADAGFDEPTIQPLHGLPTTVLIATKR